MANTNKEAVNFYDIIEQSTIKSSQGYTFNKQSDLWELSNAYIRFDVLREVATPDFVEQLRDIFV